MKKFLSLLSAFAVLIVSGCSAKQSEAPLFEKYVSDGTSYPVKIVWEEQSADLSDNGEPQTAVSTYYIASADKWYVSRDFGEETVETLYDGGVVYNIFHDEKAVFASPLSEENAAVGYIPAEPEKWVLTEKGEAQYEGKTYLYETASLDNKYVLTLFADLETEDIVYASDGESGSMARLMEITHSFDLRIFDIPEGYEVVNMP